MMQIRFFILVFLFAYFTTVENSIAQQVEIKVPTIKVYLKFIPSSNSKISEISVTYDLQYPFLSIERKHVFLTSFTTKNVCLIQTKSLSFLLNTQRVLISPGDTVEFTFDEKDKIQLTGKNEKYQNFIHYANTDFYKKNVEPYQQAQDSSLDINTYKAYCIHYYNKEQEYITNYFADAQSNTLKKYLLDESTYSLISNLCEMPEKYRSKRTSIPADYLGRQYIGLFNHPPEYFGSNYRIALLDYNGYLTEDLAGSRVQKITQLVESARHDFSLPVYHYLLILRFKRISEFGNASYTNLTANMYRELRNASLDTAILARINEWYNHFKILARNIQDFSDVKIKDAQGSTIKLGSVLQNGKPCFIDFWATWCGACIEESPYLDSAQKNRPDINFISLSVDENEEKLIAYMKRKDSTATNSFLLTEALKSKIIQDYNITEFPRFILFDQNGDCLSGDFIRPSEQLFNNQLTELLNSRN